MLSKNQVVTIRKAIEKGYTGKCTIIEFQKIVKANKSIGSVEVVVLESQPCKLYTKSVSSAKTGDIGNTVEQRIKVFISPDIVFKPGSKIIVTQDGVTNEYNNSGLPAMFPTHQEVSLEIFKEWA